jgi:hypothetical protein
MNGIELAPVTPQSIEALVHRSGAAPVAEHNLHLLDFLDGQAVRSRKVTACSARD